MTSNNQIYDKNAKKRSTKCKCGEDRGRKCDKLASVVK